MSPPSAAVSAVLPPSGLAGAHEASKAQGTTTLPVTLLSDPIARRVGVRPGAVCQSLTLVPFMPGAGRREPVLPGTLPSPHRSWKAPSWFLPSAKESHFF